MQKQEPKWRYPEKYEHGDLAEYCYKIDVNVTSSGKLISVATAEHIAMVLSALMNSSGGVLVIHVVTKAYNINLDTCQKDIVHLITQQEIWIPENVFNATVSFTKNEGAKEICFFTSKTTQLVTHKSNAYHCKQRNPEAIVNKDVLMDVIRTCTCVNTTTCEKHQYIAKTGQMQSHTDTLIANQFYQTVRPTFTGTIS